MKTHVLYTIFLIGSALLYSCNNSGGDEYKMFTKINPDGSCYREFISDVDSAFVAGDSTKNPFPVKLDSTWKKVTITPYYDVHFNEKTHKSDSSLRYMITIRKHYPTVQCLADSFRLYDSKGWDSIKPKIIFTKKFRWFYTYYEYAEIYPKVNPFKIVPVSLYLSDEEIEALYGSNMNLYRGKIGTEIRDLLIDLEKKSNAWLNRSFYEEFYALCLQNFNQLKDIPVDSITFARAKNEIYKLNSDSMESNGLEIEKCFDQYFKTKIFTSQGVFENIDQKFKSNRIFENFIQYYLMHLDYELSMPGKVIETSTPIIHGDTLTWKVDADRFFFKDYTLKAKSRRPNYWTFGVTAIIVALGLLGFWVRRK